MSKDFVNIKNKKAAYEYEFIDKYVAGIVLKGTEIKSIRNSQVNLSDSHCVFIENELWIKNLHISEYSNRGYSSHEPKRERKLLLNRQELEKIHGKVKTKGVTIVPLRIFINEKGKAKIEIIVAKGKKLFDKRESLKEKDNKRDLERIRKNY
tara:strand:+ start:95 stop:550 length:456 start_codon:yes stop_codon:yes gene_type:complete